MNLKVKKLKTIIVLLIHLPIYELFKMDAPRQSGKKGGGGNRVFVSLVTLTECIQH